MDKTAVVLLSGGLDSATVAAIAAKEGFSLAAVSFDYGQRHMRELDSARAIAAAHHAKSHRIIKIEPEIFKTSSLSSVSEQNVPKMRDVDSAVDIPSTYVPARNILFLSYALAIAEAESSNDIFIGVNALDYSGYPDCRPEFISAFQAMASIGTKTGAEGGRITIHAPLQYLKKSEIIKLGMDIGVDYSITHSCYDPIGDKACGTCDSCLLRKKGFAEAGFTDPVAYA